VSDKELYNYIKKFFIYNKNGTFKRKDRKNSNGSIDKDGYIIIKIKGKQYKAHRLVYMFFNGEFPKGEIDHINRNRKDNRIENLRVATRLENILNSKGSGFGIYLDNTNGLKKRFAFKHKNKTYRAYTLSDAISLKLKMGGKINYEYAIPKIIRSSK